MKTPDAPLFMPLEDRLPEDLPPDACLVPWQPGYVPLARYLQPEKGIQGSKSKVS